MFEKIGSAVVSVLSKVAYGIGCLCLYAIGLLIFGASIYQIYAEIQRATFSVFNLLDEVGLIIFSIAVIDVAKHIMIEEVFKERARTPREERHVFSRFLIIILTALSLEGLVLTIETAKTDISKIVFPILLFVVVAFLVIAIGVYHKLNSLREEE